MSQTNVEEMRLKIEKIVDLNIQVPLAIDRSKFVAELLEFAVLSRGEAIIQMREDEERFNSMKKKAGW